jgi:single-strand DNA-binding protein
MSGFDINTVTISGHLCRTPELRNLSSGATVCNLRIAHNERFKDASGEWADRAAFFDVTVWSGLGAWIATNVNEGDKVVVAGRLRWREWETAEGLKRQAVDITADSVIPIPRKTADAAPSEQFATGAVGGDDDIPF